MRTIGSTQSSVGVGCYQFAYNYYIACIIYMCVMHNLIRERFNEKSTTTRACAHTRACFSFSFLSLHFYYTIFLFLLSFLLLFSLFRFLAFSLLFYFCISLFFFWSFSLPHQSPSSHFSLLPTLSFIIFLSLRIKKKICLLSGIHLKNK